MTARLIMKLRVEKIRFTTPDVLHLQLVHPLRPALPEWSAGAHVDLRMPDGRVRQYSLCGDPDDRSRYEIAVKREVTGRGGSIWVHENLREGSEVHISAPRNNLPLSDKARRYVLVAGGIGITPLLSMARTLKRRNKDFTLHYCARSASQAPLLAELRDICGPSLQCWFSQNGPRFDPAAIGPYDRDTHVYVCGPQRLLDAVQSALSDMARGAGSRRSLSDDGRRELQARAVRGDGGIDRSAISRTRGQDRCSMSCATTISPCRHPAKWVSAVPANAATAMAWSCIATRCCRHRSARIG